MIKNLVSKILKKIEETYILSYKSCLIYKKLFYIKRIETFFIYYIISYLGQDFGECDVRYEQCHTSRRGHEDWWRLYKYQGILCQQQQD